MKPRWLVALVCTIYVSVWLSVTWLTKGELTDMQFLSIPFIGQGLFWLAIPIQIKQPLEAMMADPRYADVDWPEEWSDFVALAGMFVACFLLIF